jgi:hypothetical protein
MPDDASAVDVPKPEPACEKCGGALEQLTRLPKFEKPTSRNVRCLVAFGGKVDIRPSL